MSGPEGGRGIGVTFSGVTKTYGDVRAVDNVSFEIPACSIVSILGPSGCGKTTTLRLIAGFEFATSGAITIGGESMAKIPPYARPVNLVFQNYALFPHLSVGDNVAYGLRSRRNRRPKDEVNRLVASVMRQVQLTGYENRRIWELSGGQQQRVALARAIVNSPGVLLLDEPMAALDKKLRRGVQFELQSLQRELGMTFVMVTHDQQEALSLSDRIIVMNQGRVEQIGTPEDLHQRPASAFVADFIGDYNLYKGTVRGAGDPLFVEVGPHKVAAARFAKSTARPEPGRQVTIGIRPDDVWIEPSDAAAQGRDAAVFMAPAHVRNIIFLGDRVEMRLEIDGFGLVISRLPTLAYHQRQFGMGERVTCSFEAVKTTAFMD